MMAGRMCRSFLSIASTVQLVLSTERPTISSAATPLSPIAFLVAVTRHDHHSLGSCSAQPGGVWTPGHCCLLSSRVGPVARQYGVLIHSPSRTLPIGETGRVDLSSSG